MSRSLTFLLLITATMATGWAQTAPKVLFIGADDEATRGGDLPVWEKMIEWWGEENVTYLQSGASTTEDAEGHDVVVLSSTPGSGDIRNKFHELEIGVLNWEEALGRQLSLGEMGITTGNRQKYTISEIEIEDNSHLITAELPLGTFQLLENPAETWGSQWGAAIDSTDPIADELLAPGAAILANVSVEETENAGFDWRNAAIVAVEKGDSLWLDFGEAVPAPGRRVMFPLTDNTATELTEDGWNLLKRSIEWTGGVLTGGGATYSQNFDGFDDETTDLGDGSVMAGTAQVIDGKLQLTENDVAGGFASFSVPPLAGSSGGWKATFDLLISDGEGANEPADGMSFNYGNAQLGELGSAEEGMAGIADVSENISFEIDTWMNLDAEQGVNIAEKVDEVDTNLAFTNGPILEDGTEVSGQVTIVYDPVDGLSFTTTGLLTNADFENVETEFIGDDEYTFILSGRVGGANETKWIDNLVITTEEETGPDILLTFNEGEELPEGTELIGNGEVLDENGVDDSGFLKITDAANGEKGAVIFPDLLNGKAVKSFKFTADFRVGGGTESPADGFSVNLVRPDDPILESLDGNGFAASPGGEANLPEEGSQTGLGIGFDEWDSGGGDVVGFSIRVDNELVTQIPADIRNGEPDDPQSLQTGPIGPDGPGDISELTWQQFEVELKEDGKVTIKWKGETVLDNFQTTFFPSPVQIVFAGRTGGANAAHHVDNIGLTIQPLDLLAVSRISSSTEGLAFELTDSDESALDKESIALNVDGEMVTPTVTDGEEDGVTIITYASPVPYLPGTTHTYNLTANDMNGNAAVRSGAGEFSLKDSAMPYNTPLVGPDGEAGVWGVRYIWGAGTPGTTVGAIDLIQASDDADFPGEVYDTTMEVANHGTGAGYFPDDLPYPEDVEFGDDGLWDGENFVISYKGTLRITEGGLYTFGVHSDDGFGLRIFGAEFVSESGNGQLDPVVSDTVIHPAPTGDSNTRAVANLAPGDYPIEFFWYENGGGDNGEIYFAKGEFTEDADTEEWELIGPDHLVGPGALPFQITEIVKAGTDVSITWQSTEGAGYTIERASPEQLAEGDFEELQDGYEGEEGSTTFTESEVTDDEVYYRVKAE